MDSLKNAGRYVLTMALLCVAMAGSAHAQGGAATPGIEVEAEAGPKVGDVRLRDGGRHSRLPEDGSGLGRCLPPFEDTDDEGQFGGDGQSSVSVKQSRFASKARCRPVKAHRSSSSTSTCLALATMRARRRSGCRMPMANGARCSPARPTACSWTSTSSRTRSTTGARPGWSSPERADPLDPFRTDNSHFAIAIERPGNDIDGGNVRLIEGFEDAEVQNDEELPDLTAQWRIGGDWGHFQAAGSCAGSGLNSARPPTMSSGTATRWAGASTSAPRSARSATTCCAAGGVRRGHRELHERRRHGSRAAARQPGPRPARQRRSRAAHRRGRYYDHYWSDRWSSSIGYSYTEVDNTNFQDPGAFHRGDYASVNLLTYPGENLMMGVELMWGEREDNNDATGDDTRIQFSVKYSFAKPL